jgi:hypothetical protein
MKQYDQIYVRNNLDQNETKLMVIGQGDEYPLGGITEIENVIVLTIEELKDLWMAGFNRADPENTGPAPTFQSYLTSKGIL